jgi:RCC1 and BTB domain-containing protein
MGARRLVFNAFKTNNLSDSPLIYKVPTNLKFKHVDCNSYHSLLLSTDDKLYGLGYNSYYQLGTGESADKSSITEVKCIKGTPTSFCCNFSFSTVVTDYKNIYVLGQNWLGTNNNNTNVYEMTLPNPEDKIVHLTGGSFHIMALTESGKLYSAGENSAKLGREREYNAPTWDLVTLTKDKIVTNVCCLGDISVAITIDGTVYLFCSAYGWSTEPTVFTCTRKFPQPKALTCSLYHIMIVSSM